MDENFASRFGKWMEETGINANQITVKAGLSIGLIGKLLNGGKGLSIEQLEKVLYAYPDLNVDWLITGRGEMISQRVVHSTEKNNDERPTLRDIITDQRKEISSLNREIGALTEKVNRLERKYDDASFRKNVADGVVPAELELEK